ncbi:MAG TPA: metallopeptidase family protein [Bdellovibrionota bacterium]|jgi:predicted Zn-dependent protease with MMP-like domain
MALPEKQRLLFDTLLDEIITSLPEEFRKMLEEVPVVVDDEPSRTLLEEMGIYVPNEESDLCGVHSGPSVSSLARNVATTSAPLIQLFRGPIFRISGSSKKSLKRQIRITLVHELGHHFDFSEDELEDRGYG